MHWTARFSERGADGQLKEMSVPITADSIHDAHRQLRQAHTPIGTTSFELEPHEAGDKK